MFSVAPSTAGTPYQHPKWSILTSYALCPLLLGLSAYGFWEWLEIPIRNHFLTQDQLFYLICLAVIPLSLFVALCINVTQKIVHNRLSASYQMRLDQLQHRFNVQEEFVHWITDSNPESIAIYDRDNRYWFVNLGAARRLGRDKNDIAKKSLDKIIGYDQARKLEKRLNEVRMSGKSIETLDQVRGDDGQLNFIQSHYEAVDAFGDFSGGVMVREEDVTGLIVERERRANMLRQVIGTLVAVVDRRDPYASGHSGRVGRISRIIAEEMLLPESEIDAAEIAGSLMNFGKVLVPREILTKATALTPEELQRVRDSILTSADILSIIDFEGPVVQTLRQVMERYDGSGVPSGLKGGQILMTARVVTVANAYVALVSPRAHRPSLGVKEAMDNLMRDADRLYDRNVVEALSNCVRNRRDKLDWADTSTQN